MVFYYFLRYNKRKCSSVRKLKSPKILKYPLSFNVQVLIKTPPKIFMIFEVLLKTAQKIFDRIVTKRGFCSQTYQNLRSEREIALRQHLQVLTQTNIYTHTHTTGTRNALIPGSLLIQSTHTEV